MWPLSLAMPRPRGNPNWGRPGQPVSTMATEFEMQVRRLGLTSATCADSLELRDWCAENKNRCYIPESLLRAWRIGVDSDLSGDMRSKSHR
jgi:hypothetical protein